MAGSNVVSAKGIEHPESMKWIVSGGRPPVPEEHATYYDDWKPLSGSPQDMALQFLYNIERGDQASAKELLHKTDVPEWLEEEFTRPLPPDSTIDHSTLTYQTTDYELDRAEVTLAFVLDSDTPNATQVKAHTLVRKNEDEWKISNWKMETAATNQTVF